MQCPFHNEKTASLKIYEGGRGWTCFGCGQSGDEISFVQKLFNLSFPDALKKIDADFNLNIFTNKTFEELRQARHREQALKAKAEKEKREREKAESEYWAIFKEWKRLHDNRKLYEPKSYNEDLHPLFVETLQKLAYQEYLLDVAENRRWENERGNHKADAS